MQFYKNGPDIPERLLQAHEDGHVVFFCGAGISYPAGLPGFKELVNQLYDRLCPVPDAEQEAARKAEQFDTAVALLEEKHIGGREHVRAFAPSWTLCRCPQRGSSFSEARNPRSVSTRSDAAMWTARTWR